MNTLGRLLKKRYRSYRTLIKSIIVFITLGKCLPNEMIAETDLSYLNNTYMFKVD